MFAGPGNHYACKYAFFRLLLTTTAIRGAARAGTCSEEMEACVLNALSSACLSTIHTHSNGEMQVGIKGRGGSYSKDTR